MHRHRVRTNILIGRDALRCAAMNAISAYQYRYPAKQIAEHTTKTYFSAL